MCKFDIKIKTRIKLMIYSRRGELEKSRKKQDKHIIHQVSSKYEVINKAIARVRCNSLSHNIETLQSRQSVILNEHKYCSVNKRILSWISLLIFFFLFFILQKCRFNSIDFNSSCFSFRV